MVPFYVKSTQEPDQGSTSRLKIAITGWTGFIGKHVLAEMVKNNLQVIAIARRLPPVLPELPKGRFVELDISDVSSGSYELLGNPDGLIHLAWGGLPDYKSLHHFEQELPMQYRFLRTLIQSGLGSVVVTGTCLEYGMQSGPLSEGMETRPNNSYAFAKDVLRRQLEYLSAAFPFLLTWARLFYVYGEQQPEHSLLPQLKKAVQQGRKVFNMSGGEQLRDYMPVAEVAKCIVSLAMAKRNFGTVNICSGKPVSVRRLVENWIQENEWKIDLNLGCYPYPDYEPLAFWGVRNKLDSCMESR